MKRLIIFTSLLLTALILFASHNDFAWASKKSEVKVDISEAKKLMEKLERDDELKEFIPYRNYYDAKIYLDTASYQFNEEKEYLMAGYYAILAIVEIETTFANARARQARYKKQQIEKDFLKKLALSSSKKSGMKIIMMEADLQKDGSNYKRVLLDSIIFNKNSFTINDKGKEILNPIYAVLKAYPRSKISVIGHTKAKDSGNTQSQKKADALTLYFTKNKGVSQKRIVSEGMGNSYPIEINKKIQSMDRVEIVISGIK